MPQTNSVLVEVSPELVEHLGEWSQPVRIRIIETPGIGTGYMMVAEPATEQERE